jgi:phage/plasmid-like protein (TIGR03299 family)
MATSTKPRPTDGLATDRDGDQAGDVTAAGAHYMPGGRFPAFVGLARNTGGTYVEAGRRGMKLDTAIRKARMDYTVQFEKPVSHVRMPDGRTVTVEYPQRGTVAVWPDGTASALGTVRSKYSICQNDEAARMGQAIMDEGGANVAAAGVYGQPHGAKTYMAFRLPDGLMIGGEDPYDLYFTILNSHDGESALSALFGPIRLACTNMTTATFGAGVKNRFKLRHSGSMEFKIAEVQRALGISYRWTEDWAREAELLLRTPLRGDALDGFLRDVMPTPERVKSADGASNWDARRVQLKTIINHADTNQFGRGTAYAAFNGVVEWVDFFRPVNDPRPETRFRSVLDGGEHEKYKANAFTLLRQYAVANAR